MDAYLNPQPKSGAGQPPQAGAAEVPSPSQQQQQQQQEQQEQQQPAPSGTSDVAGAGAGAGKHAKNTTAPSRLGKKNNRPVPLREKKTTAPSRLGKKKKTPRPASKKKTNRPVPPRILPRKIPSRPVPPRISTPIFCQSRAPAEMKKVGQPSIFPPSRPVEILAVHVKPWKLRHGRSLPRWFAYAVEVGR